MDFKFSLGFNFGFKTKRQKNEKKQGRDYFVKQKGYLGCTKESRYFFN